MEALTGAVQSVVSALTPKKNVKNQTVPMKNNRKNTMKNANIVVAPKVNMNMNTNTNSNNMNINTGFEPGSRENIYASFQSASAEGGRRKNRRRQTKKKHRKTRRR